MELSWHSLVDQSFILSISQFISKTESNYVLCCPSISQFNSKTVLLCALLPLRSLSQEFTGLQRDTLLDHMLELSWHSLVEQSYILQLCGLSTGGELWVMQSLNE